jgi:hypothetical protein
MSKNLSRSSSLSVARPRDGGAAAFITLVVLTCAREERCRPTESRRDCPDRSA